MEKRLQTLTNANQPENRAKWAKKWKEQGGKVIGIITSYVPEEVIHAAGMLPWGISGTWREATPQASAYRPGFSCLYCTHVLESILTGELDFLDCLVTPQRDDDVKRLWDVIHYLKKPALSHIMYLPHTKNELTLPMWGKSITELKEILEKLGGSSITEKKMVQSIETFNKMRALLLDLYKLRNRETPPLTGAEYLGITTAARVMPKEDFIKELEQLLPYLKNRKAPLKQVKPRLLVLSEFLDNPAYIALVESAGALVAMDDMDTGSTYFWDPVQLNSGNPIDALAYRYMTGPADSRMENWQEQANRLLGWVKEFKIDGVLELRQLYSFPADFRFPFLRDQFKKAGVPFMSLSREYHLAHVGMLKTRIEAFIEMLRMKP